MRRMFAAVTAAALSLAMAAPAVAAPPMEPGHEGILYCRIDGNVTEYDVYHGHQWPAVSNLYFRDSNAVAVPITVYLSDADGTRGDWIWSGKGQIDNDMPGLTWCWCQYCLPGWDLSPDYWVGGDWAFRGASDQQP